MNMSFMLLNGDAASATGSDGHFLISYYVTLIVIFVVFYLILTYPKGLKEKKAKEARKQMLKSMEIGDVVVTTCGFYGIVIDITEEDIILEFGSNKNCRIPMSKDAIAKVEK